MKTLLATVQYEFPDFKAVTIATMALPLYYARLEVEVLEPRELTTFQTYLLHAVALGVTAPAKLSWLLGVDEADMAVPAGSLLQVGYLTLAAPVAEQGRSLALTPLGKQFLNTQGPQPVPKRQVGQLHFNAVTWQPIPKEDDTLSVDEMLKQGLPALPPQEHQRPTLGDFPEREVAAALNGVPFFHGKDLIAILNLRKLEPEYLAPVQIVLLEHQHSNERRVAVYRDGVQQEEESRIVQRQYENGQFTMPREAAVLHDARSYLPAALDPEVAQSTQALLTNETLLADLAAELEVQQEIHSQSQDERERRELAARIVALETQLQTKRSENERLHAALAEYHVTFLRTEEHRAFLERALVEAQEEVLIIVPWMNSRACNADLCRLIGEAVGRGVSVRIGYGFGQDRPRDAERHRRNTRRVQQDLDRYTPRGCHVEWHQTTGTHQKIVVCDRRYAAIGSFNWLSYRGERDEGYRRETSSVFRSREAVAQVAEIALEALRS